MVLFTKFESNWLKFLVVFCNKRGWTSKECIKAGGSPRNAGGGIFASAPDRGREPEFRGRARPRNSGGGPVPGIPGVDSGGGNRNSGDGFRFFKWISFFFHVEMHVKALRPILPQAINNKVKTNKFCVFSIVNNFILFWVSLCICTLTFYMHRAVNRREWSW